MALARPHLQHLPIPPAEPRTALHDDRRVAVLRPTGKVGHEAPAAARGDKHGFGEVIHRPGPRPLGSDPDKLRTEAHRRGERPAGARRPKYQSEPRGRVRG